MKEESVKEYVKETLELRNSLHKKFADSVNSSSFENGTTIQQSGSYVMTEIWVNNGVGTACISNQDLANEKARYMFRVKPLVGTVTPLRIGVDNCHRDAHIDIPGVHEGKTYIPLKDPMNMGNIGSVAFGCTLTEEELQESFNKYFSSM